MLVGRNRAIACADRNGDESRAGAWQPALQPGQAEPEKTLNSLSILVPQTVARLRALSPVYDKEASSF